MTPLLEVSDLRVQYPLSRRMFARFRRDHGQFLQALDGVSICLGREQSIGVVGESGCGKTTLARTIIGLQQPTSGTIRLDGAELGIERDTDARRRIQIVFQDPSSSLNPALTVGQAISELIRFHSLVPPDSVQRRCEELLELVELPTRLLGSYPRGLSGGQRQRVGIARALAVEPDVLVADEPTAALDVSVQAAILNLLMGLKTEPGLSLLLISHDLAVVRQTCERVAVMYLGRVVEEGETEAVFTDPRHPYTQALLRAVPRLGRLRGDAALRGEPPSPVDVPSGCRFHPRCPIAADVCRRDDPALLANEGRAAACHFAWESDRAGQDPHTMDNSV